ncbi:alkaline phosphatase family protein [Sphingoaurantiacus capsulatus]|uniref:Alkaline phosphatase family protein n=1 Tax=Sphingoaurantiacus capsulatus TaxID=1771310 RepID=A0ABV7XDJ3_9SPHN
MRFLTLILAALTLTACTATSDRSASAIPFETREPVTVLVSIDGFRPDYLDRGITPNLSRLAAGGVRGAMRPSFPSKTFPNHWTLVTGLRPDRHGIVANRFEAEGRTDVFTMASDDPFWWNAAVPIWVDAEKAGVRTATMFWPGSIVAIGGTRAAAWPYKIDGGTRAQDFVQYYEEVGTTQRVATLIDWLRRPATTRPRFLTTYFEAVDTIGHENGPDHPETNKAIAEVDAAIGLLVSELAALGQPANLVIVADHGMAAVSRDRAVALDTILTAGDYRVIETGPYAGIVATPGKEAAVEAALLKPHPHMACWRKAEIPARLHYGRNPRVPPYLCLAEVGWQVVDKTGTAFGGGAHGYDGAAPDMAALFLGHGPAFAPGTTLPAFDNPDVHALLRRLLGLPPATGTDGSDAVFVPVLR